jgi:hypothetical protein
MVVALLGAFGANLGLVAGETLMSNCLAIITLHWAGPWFVDAHVC